MRKIELSEHFTKRKMLLYSLPSIFEAFATTSFQMVDGFFVSNLLGLAPYVAVDLISPVFFLLYALGFMFGEGASALISQVMGEGDPKRGREIFSMTTTVMLIFGAVVGVLAALLMPALARLVGADEDSIGYCIEYGRTLVLFLPVFLINSGFMSLWITAGKGWCGMIVSAINGLINVVLDWLFMGPMKMGVEGAALATALGAMVSAVITLIYFWRSNRSTLRFTRFTLRDFRELIQICTNGASSMVDSVAGNLVTLMMNSQLLRLFSEQQASLGLLSHHIEESLKTFRTCKTGRRIGENQRIMDRLNKEYLSKRLRTNRLEFMMGPLMLLLGNLNLLLTLIFGVGLCLLFIVCAKPVARIYVGYSAQTCALTIKALRILALGCIVFGFNLFVSSFFTGIGNGLVSALISLCGSLVAPLVMMFIVPAIFGGEIIWFSLPMSMLITTVVCVICLYKAYYQKKALW